MNSLGVYLLELTRLRLYQMEQLVFSYGYRYLRSQTPRLVEVGGTLDLFGPTLPQHSHPELGPRPRPEALEGVQGEDPTELCRTCFNLASSTLPKGTLQLGAEELRL